MQFFEIIWSRKFENFYKKMFSKKNSDKTSSVSKA